MLKLLDKHRDAKPSTFVRTGCPLLTSSYPLLPPALHLFLRHSSVLHAASCSHSSSSSSSCPLLPAPFGAAQLLHFISVSQPPSSPSLLFFSVSGLFLPCTMSVCPTLCVCVCVNRAFVCKCGHLISICVLDCFALHLLIFAI